MITAGNVDDRQPVPAMTKKLFGKLFGDRGYISQKLFEELYERGLQLITKLKKNMKNKLMPMIDKLLLRKRALIETVNDQLKNICQIEHTRHRSKINFLVNLLAALIAYIYHGKSLRSISTTIRSRLCNWLAFSLAHIELTLYYRFSK